MAIVLCLVVLEAIYVRALRRVTVPRGQVAAWHGAIVLALAGLLGPVDRLAGEGLAFHLLQHMLLAELAAPLLVIGVRNPVVECFVPHGAWRLRAVLHRLQAPLVSLPLYGVLLYAWHVSLLFDAAVRHPAVHALQHLSLLAAGVLVWWPVLEPERRRLRGDLWKIGHVVTARFLAMLLGLGYVLIPTPIYTAVYGRGERGLGLRPIADQQLAGGILVVLEIVLMMAALTYFFVRAGRQHDADEQRAQARREAALT
jgi:putative membrane protein